MVYFIVILAMFGLGLALRGLAVFHLYIIVFDMLVTAGVLWFVVLSKFELHTVFKLIICAIAAQVVYMIFRTRIGFWIVTPIFSALWAYGITTIVTEIFSIQGDKIWFWALIICSFVYTCWLHYVSLRRAEDGAGPALTEIETD